MEEHQHHILYLGGGGHLLLVGIEQVVEVGDHQPMGVGSGRGGAEGPELMVNAILK